MAEVSVYARRNPKHRLWKFCGVLLQKEIMHSIGSDDMSDLPEIVQSFFGWRVAARGRMNQESPIAQANDRHPVRQRDTKKANELAVIPNFLSECIESHSHPASLS